MNPHTLRLCDENRRVISLRRRAKNAPKAGAIEYDLLVPIPPPKTSGSHKTRSLRKAVDWIDLRVVGGRTGTGEVIRVLTTLPRQEAPAPVILRLYRLRWQIELLFKRLKSLLHLDALPSRRGPQQGVGCLRAYWQPHWPRNCCSPRARFRPGAANCGPDARRKGCTHSAWSRFRMAPWAMRVVILGRGPWVMVDNENHLERLANPPRRRQPARVPSTLFLF